MKLSHVSSPPPPQHHLSRSDTGLSFVVLFWGSAEHVFVLCSAACFLLCISFGLTKDFFTFIFTFTFILLIIKMCYKLLTENHVMTEILVCKIRQHKKLKTTGSEWHRKPRTVTNSYTCIVRSYMWLLIEVSRQAKTHAWHMSLITHNQLSCYGMLFICSSPNVWGHKVAECMCFQYTRPPDNFIP